MRPPYFATLSDSAEKTATDYAAWGAGPSPLIDNQLGPVQFLLLHIGWQVAVFVFLRT